LPFLLPSLFNSVCTANDPGPLQQFSDFYISWTCRTNDGKFAQALNLLLSIGTTLLLLLLAQLLKLGNRALKLSTLILLANLTVYYRTFAQVRGKPHVTFFTALSAILILHTLKSSSFHWKLVIGTGFSLGSLILSRQWGSFIYPAMGLLAVLIYLRDHPRGRSIFRQFVVSGLISLLIGGFFYVHLYKDYGSFTAFNIHKTVYPSPQQAYLLLRKTHSSHFELFREPVRAAFSGAMLPILCSETWGITGGTSHS
jgi:4-amino-4-deoxy-L-arabinose transferase-like glycosyltransferase